MPNLCQTAETMVRKPLILLVGVAGFEPATPSSRTMGTAHKPAKHRHFSRENTVNVARTSAYFRAVSVPGGANGKTEN